jgi:hypothetical protein
VLGLDGLQTLPHLAGQNVKTFLPVRFRGHERIGATREVEEIISDLPAGSELLIGDSGS